MSAQHPSAHPRRPFSMSAAYPMRFLFRTRYPDLSYANSSRSPLFRGAVRLLEWLNGREILVNVYEDWLAQGKRGCLFEKFFQDMRIDLDIKGLGWPPAIAAQTPAIIAANHPYGILDGAAAVVLAKRLGRPCHLLLNALLKDMPGFENGDSILPVDFSQGQQAIDANIQTRKDALKAMARGETIVIFPGGNIADVDKTKNTPREAPWKPFVGRLIQESRATVLPLFFEGQNSSRFHLLGKLSLGLRHSSIIGETLRHTGKSLKIRAGKPIPYEELAAFENRKLISNELYRRIMLLGDDEDASESSQKTADRLPSDSKTAAA